MCSLLFKSKNNSNIIYPLNNNKITIGSSLNANIRLNNVNIESIHCVIINSKEEVILENRSIENPVILNGCQLKTKEILNHGDKITINDKEFEFSDPKQKEKFKFKSILTRKSFMPSTKMQTAMSTSKIPLPKNRMKRLPTRRSLSMSASKSVTKKSSQLSNLRTSRLSMSTGKIAKFEKRTISKPSLRVSLFKDNIRLSEESPPDCLNNVTTVQNDLQTTIQSITPRSDGKRQKPVFDQDNCSTSKLEENPTENLKISFNETSKISVQQLPITLSEDNRLSTTRRSIRRKSNQFIENSSTPTNTPKKKKDLSITESVENDTLILEQSANINDSSSTVTEFKSTTTRMSLRRSNQLDEISTNKNISFAEKLTNEEAEEAEQLLITNQFEKTNLQTIEEKTSIMDELPLFVHENHQSPAVRRSIRRKSSNLNVNTPKKYDDSNHEENQSTTIRKSMGRKSNLKNISVVEELSKEPEIELEEKKEIQEEPQLLMTRKSLRRKSNQFKDVDVKSSKINVSILDASVNINDSSIDGSEDQQSPAIRKSNNLITLMNTPKKYDSILEQSSNTEDFPVTVTEENQMSSNMKSFKKDTPIKDTSIFEESPNIEDSAIVSTEENESLVTRKSLARLSTKTPKKNVSILDASIKINDSSISVTDQKSPAFRKSLRKSTLMNTPKKYDSILEQLSNIEDFPMTVTEENQTSSNMKSFKTDTPIVSSEETELLITEKSLGRLSTKTPKKNVSMVDASIKINDSSISVTDQQSPAIKKSQRKSNNSILEQSSNIEDVPMPVTEENQMSFTMKSFKTDIAIKDKSVFEDSPQETESLVTKMSLGRLSTKTPKKNVSIVDASIKINDSSVAVTDQQSPAIRKSLKKSRLMNTPKKYYSIFEQSSNIEDVPMTVTEENQMSCNMKSFKTDTPIKDKSVFEESANIQDSPIDSSEKSLITQKSLGRLSTQTPKKNVSIVDASIKINDSSISVTDQQSPAITKSQRKSNNSILEQSSNIEDFSMTVTEENQMSSIKSFKKDTPIKDTSIFEESANILDSPIVSTEDMESLVTKKSLGRLSTKTPKKNISTIEELPEIEESIQIFDNNSNSFTEKDSSVVEIVETQSPTTTTKRSKRFPKVVEFEEIGPRGVKRVRESTSAVLQTNKKKKMSIESTFNESNLEMSTSDDCSDLFASSQEHIEDDDDDSFNDDEIINNEENRSTINNSNIENSFNVNNIETIQNNITINIHTNDNISNISGIKELFTPPKELKSPVNDLSNVDGVKKLFKTPKVHKSPLNDLTKIKGVCGMFKTPKQQKSPNNDLTKIVGVKKMFKTPKEQKSPKNDLTNVDGIKNIFKTSKKQKSPRNDLTEIVGVKKMFTTPKIQKSPENDLTKIDGVKKMFKTPKEQKTPKNDLTQISNIKNLMKTPKPIKSPSNDLTNVSGINYVFKTPKPSTRAKDNECMQQSPINLKGLFEKQKSPLNDLSNVEGVDVLYQEIQEETRRSKRITSKSLKETSTPVVRRTTRRRQMEETNVDGPEQQQQDETNKSDKLVEDTPVIEQRSLRNRKTKKEQENIRTHVIERKTRGKKLNEINEEEHKENTPSKVIEGSVIEQKSLHGRKKNMPKQELMLTSTPVVNESGQIDIISIQKEENVENIEPKLTRRRQKQLEDGTEGLTPILKTRRNKSKSAESENQNVIEPKLTRRRQKQLEDGTEGSTTLRKTCSNKIESAKGENQEENIEERPTKSTRGQKRKLMIKDKVEETSVRRTRKKSNNDNQISIAEEKSVSTTKRSTRKRQKSLEENENNQSGPLKRQTRKKASEKKNIEEESKISSENEESNEESSKRRNRQKVEENQQTKSSRGGRKNKIEENKEVQPEGGRVLRSRKK